MSYTNLSNNPEYLWNQVSPMLDKYATFRWDDEDMTLYHTFIINEKKGSLKFYNGPSFSNSYTQPQFESASSRFTGVTFKTQQISFTIAVYAVTAEQYRKLLYKLHPYTIGNLSFAFDKDWRYVCKLSNISDSNRYIVGHYNENNITKELYYTELKLTFDIVGDAVAQSTEEIGYGLSSSNNSYTFTMNNNSIENKPISELDTPFLFTFGVQLIANAQNPILNLRVERNSFASEENNTTSIQLFNIILQNLTEGYTYYFEYNSQTGDLCLIDGDQRKIITMLSTFKSGNRIVSLLETKNYLLEGTFNGGDIGQTNSQTKLIFTYSNCKVIVNAVKGCGINCYARRNLI